MLNCDMAQLYRKLFLFVLVNLLFFTNPLLGGEAAQEATTTPSNAEEVKTAEEIALAVRKGEVKWLVTAGGEKILSIYHAAAIAKAKGVVLILPDNRDGPAALGIIETLRTALPPYGWATLTVMLPAESPPEIPRTTEVPDEKKEQPQPIENPTDKRITAALTFLNEIKSSPIVLLGHGRGAHAVGKFLTTGEQYPDVKGVILLSAQFDSITESQTTLTAFATMKLPVLDVVGEHDYVDIYDQGKDRALFRHKIQPEVYRGYSIAGADHRYLHFELPVLKRTRIWLNKYIKTPSKDSEEAADQAKP